MKFSTYCLVCGKIKGNANGGGGHPACSKKLQKLMEKEQKKRLAPKKLNDRKRRYFASID